MAAPRPALASRPALALSSALALAAGTAVVVLYAVDAWGAGAMYFDSISLLLAGAAVVAARRAGRGATWGWWSLAGGAALLATGNIAWDLAASSAVRSAGGAPDWVHVVGYAAIFSGAAALALTRHRSETAETALLLGSVLAAAALGAVDLLAARPESLTSATVAVWFYAVLGLGTVAAVCRLVVPVPAARVSSALLLGGVTLRGVADLAYATRTYDGAYKNGSWLDLAWSLGKVLMAAALLDPRLPRALRELAPRHLARSRSWSTLGLTLLTVVAPALLLLPDIGSLERWAAAGTVLVLALLAQAHTTVARRSERVSRGRLMESEQRYRSLFEGNSAPMLIIDPDSGRIEDANAAAARTYGWTIEELTAMTVGELNTLPDDELRRSLSAARRGRVGRFEFRHRTAAGTVLDVDVFTGTVRIEGVDRLFSTIYDASDRARAQRGRADAERRLRHLALFDPLTELPNRTSVLRQLDTTLAEGDGAWAVLLIDVDRFKAVNDAYGHSAGDQLLVQLAARLRALLDGHETVARLGSDEFVAIIAVAGEREATERAQQIADAVGQPFQLEVGESFLTVSTGVAMARPGQRPAELLHAADVAMHHAKEHGRSGIQVFGDWMTQRTRRLATMESALHAALGLGQLVVHYQPIVDLRDSTPVSAEALLRWQHPRWGAVPPDTFIPLAESTGVIKALGMWVLQQACGQAEEWRRENPDRPAASVAVNLSATQFTDPGLPALVADVLAASGLPAELLCLEITETVLMEDADVTLQALRQLKALGVELHLDDFGTGYSSLAYLERFPVDTLKIDRRFVSGLGTSRDDEHIVTAVIQLAHTLDKRVIAEGIETPGQAAALRSLGCDFGQGFLFARPCEVATLSWGRLGPEPVRASSARPGAGGSG